MNNIIVKARACYPRVNGDPWGPASAGMISFFSRFVILGVMMILFSSSVLASAPTKGVKDKKSTNDLLKDYLDLASFRHRVLSENVANVNTPGYKANEVEMPKKVSDLAQVQTRYRKIPLVMTSMRHIRGKDEGGGRFAAHKLKDPYEVKLNGNNVSMAQQMSKLSQNNSSYNTALKAYQSNYGLIDAVNGK